MATELSNYDNDYRERYRVTQADVCEVGVEAAATAYNIIPMPDETTYGLYGDSDLENGDLADSAAWPLQAAAVAVGTALPNVTSLLGPIQGRYSLDFAVTEDGDVGEPRSIADVSIPQGAVAPASPQVGNLWFDTANLQLMVYINDGSSLQWVAAS
jgi:hypothetical protein